MGSKFPGTQLKKILTLFAFLFLLSSFQTPQASASWLEITCNGDDAASDCLTEGWVVTDGSRLLARIECVKNDCRKYGWEEFAGVQSTQTVCLGQGCFETGWRTYDSYNRIVAQSLCQIPRSRNVQASSCMKAGWILQEQANPRGPIYESRFQCTDGKCDEHGWSIFSGGQRGRVVCKTGGCFKKGWILSF